MGIIADQELINNRQLAAMILQNVIDLKAQKITVNTLLQILKNKIKIDVADGRWEKDDFIAAGKNLTMKELIVTKLANVKTELQNIKSKVKGLDYEIEIQAVIDIL